MKNAERFSLLVDDRELRGPMREALARCRSLEVEVGRLAVGDYVVDGALVCERKTLSDLALSIKQGRLFSQALRLAGADKPAALILEGTSADLAGSGMRWEAIQGALITVSLFMGLSLLRTRGPDETVRTFLYAARQRRAIAYGALPRRGRRPRGKAALQAHILQGLPGIGPERARRLIEHFGSVEAALAAGIEALGEVPGIGRGTAEKIRWAVKESRAEYRAAGNDFAVGSLSFDCLSHGYR